MSEKEVVIEFENCSAADADQFAKELAELLSEKQLNSNVRKSRAGTQNAGDLVSILFDPAVISALVTVITVFLKRNTGVTIIVKDKNGEKIANNLDSRDAPKMAEAFARAPTRE